MDSTGGFREYTTGLKDAGQVTMEMNFTEDSYKLMNGIYLVDGAAGIRSWALTLNNKVRQDSTRFLMWFRASVLSLPLNIPIADKITATATLRLTGQPLIGTVANVYSGEGPIRAQGSPGDANYQPLDKEGTAKNADGTFSA